jgi:hypothetical protein
MVGMTSYRNSFPIDVAIVLTALVLQAVSSAVAMKHSQSGLLNGSAVANSTRMGSSSSSASTGTFQDHVLEDGTSNVQTADEVRFLNVCSNVFMRPIL